MRVQKGSAIHHVRCPSHSWSLVLNKSNIHFPLSPPHHLSGKANLMQGETAALENSGRLPASAYKGATMYTTLSPCDMWYVAFPFLQNWVIISLTLP